MSYALLYVALAGGIFVLPGSDGLPLAPTVVMLFAMAALFLAAARTSERVDRVGTRMLVVLGGAVAAVSVAALILCSTVVSVPPWLAYVLAALYAVGFVLIKLAGARDVLLAERTTILFAVSMIMVWNGFCLIVGGWGFPADTSRKAFVLVMIGILVMFFFFSGDHVSREGMDDEAKPVDGEQPVERVRLSMATAVSYGIVGCALGFFVFHAVGACGFSGALVLVGVAMLAASGVATCLLLAKKGSLLMIAPAFRFTLFPAVVFALALMFAPSGWGQTVCLALLLATLFVREIARVVNRLVIATESKVDLMHLYAWASVSTAVGLFLGAVLAVIVAHLGATEAGVAAVIALLSLGETIAPYGADRLTVPEAPATRGDDGTERTSLWRLACEDVATEKGFTPRECDVALLLSRGRSAEVIARNLGISVYTVKTHVSSIYRKTASDSHQDFIDMIEQRYAQRKQESREPKERL